MHRHDLFASLRPSPATASSSGPSGEGIDEHPVLPPGSAVYPNFLRAIENNPDALKIDEGITEHLADQVPGHRATKLGVYDLSRLPDGKTWTQHRRIDASTPVGVCSTAQ